MEEQFKISSNMGCCGGLSEDGNSLALLVNEGYVRWIEIKDYLGYATPLEKAVNDIYLVANYNANKQAGNTIPRIYYSSDDIANIIVWYQALCTSDQIKPYVDQPTATTTQADKDKTIALTAQFSTQPTDLVEVVLYELYYAVQRGEVVPAMLIPPTKTQLDKIIADPNTQKWLQTMSTTPASPSIFAGFTDSVTAVTWLVGLGIGGYLLYEFLPRKKA